MENEIIIKCSLEEMAKAFFKDYEIIWHDPNVNSKENQQYMAQLEKICKVKTFTEWKEADKYIKSAKTIYHVITSGTNGELLVKEIFSSANVPNILTFCREKDNHSTWTKNYQKILCTETKVEDVISRIQTNLSEWHKQTSSFKLDLPAFAPIFDDRDKSDMNNLHLYLKVLPNFSNRDQAKKDLLELSKEVYTNEENKELIADFERTYDKYNMKGILKWYTKQSFVYKIINNCLRLATSDSIQYCRFLLKDVEKAIKDQYQENSKNFSGLLYRGAYLLEEEWLTLKANMGKEIEMHGFLSVTKDERIALKFVKADPSKKVFIIILVPKGPNEEEQGFAEVEEFSAFPDEQEVLFNVRSRFTVLETDDGGSKGSSYRHLVLLYGAQALRKFVAEKNPHHQVSIEDIENISGSRCQGPPNEMTEKMLFKSLKDPVKPIYSCKGCLDPKLGPFLCVSLTGERPVAIKGCLLMNSRQAKIPLYGYQCSKCGVKNQKGYFVCTDCCEKKMKWCENCFENSLSCMESGHAIILETLPFSFWCDKMSENELNHLNFQSDLAVMNPEDVFQQAEMFYETHEYDKAVEYYNIYIRNNKGKSKDIALANCYNNLGLVYFKQGEYKKALEYHLKSLEIKKSVHGEHHSSVGVSCNSIGLVCANQGDYAKALEYHWKSLNIIKAIYGENHSEVASLYNNIGLVYEKQGDHEKALDYYSKSLDINKSIYGETHPEVSASRNNIGSIYEKSGDYKKALGYHLKSLDILKLIYGEYHPDVASFYNNIGLVYENQGECKEALESHLKSLEIRKSIHGENHPDVATSYNNIGLAYFKQGKYKKALKSHSKSLKIRRFALTINHPVFANSYNNMGLVYENQGKYKKALKCQLKSVKIKRIIHQENHPDVATSYQNIGSLYYHQGDNKKALEFSSKSLDIKKLLYKEDHPEIAASLNNIGAIYDIQGEHEEALKCYLESLKINKLGHGENHAEVANSYNNIGMAYQNQGKFETALEFHLKCLAIRESVHEGSHPDIALSFNNIGSVYYNQEKFEMALEFFLKSLDIDKSVHGENHPNIANSYDNLGSFYRKQGKDKQALEYYLKSLCVEKSLYGENDPNLVPSYLRIGVIYEDLKEYEQALECYVKSLDICKLVNEENDPQLAALHDKIHKVTLLAQSTMLNS